MPKRAHLGKESLERVASGGRKNGGGKSFAAEEVLGFPLKRQPIEG